MASLNSIWLHSRAYGQNICSANQVTNSVTGPDIIAHSNEWMTAKERCGHMASLQEHMVKTSANVSWMITAG